MDDMILRDLEQLFGLDGTQAVAQGPGFAELVFAICLSFVLTLVIAAVYQRTHRGTTYTQDYVVTLILLGTVVTVIIMGIGQSVAAAFGIFAAFSIIRFRRAVPEARDVGFVFFAMSIGLASGSGFYALAVISTLLICAFILLLWRLDLFAPERPTHQLRVRVTPDIDYDEAFEEPFANLLARYTLLSVESVQAGLMTELRYAIQLSPDATPRELVLALQERNGNNRVLVTSAAQTLE